MEVKTKKTMEAKKGMLSGKNVRLNVEISVALNEQEKELIQKYHDPYISTQAVIQQYFQSKESYDVIKGIQGNTDLSSFSITAHVDEGYDFMGNLETFEKAVIAELTEKINYLKSLDNWEGEEVLEV